MQTESKPCSPSRSPKSDSLFEVFDSGDKLVVQTRHDILFAIDSIGDLATKLQLDPGQLKSAYLDLLNNYVHPEPLAPPATPLPGSRLLDPIYPGTVFVYKLETGSQLETGSSLLPTAIRGNPGSDPHRVCIYEAPAADVPTPAQPCLAPMSLIAALEPLASQTWLYPLPETLDPSKTYYFAIECQSFWDLETPAPKMEALYLELLDQPPASLDETIVVLTDEPGLRDISKTLIKQEVAFMSPGKLDLINTCILFRYDPKTKLPTSMHVNGPGEIHQVGADNAILFIPASYQQIWSDPVCVNDLFLENIYNPEAAGLTAPAPASDLELPTRVDLQDDTWKFSINGDKYEIPISDHGTEIVFSRDVQLFFNSRNPEATMTVTGNPRPVQLGVGAEPHGIIPRPCYVYGLGQIPAPDNMTKSYQRGQSYRTIIPCIVQYELQPGTPATQIIGTVFHRAKTLTPRSIIATSGPLQGCPFRIGASIDSAGNKIMATHIPVTVPEFNPSPTSLSSPGLMYLADLGLTVCLGQELDLWDDDDVEWMLCQGRSMFKEPADDTESPFADSDSGANTAAIRHVLHNKTIFKLVAVHETMALITTPLLVTRFVPRAKLQSC